MARVRLGSPLLCLFWAAVGAYAARREKDCLPAPYLYITFHGGEGNSDVNTVYRYSRDGCHLGEALDAETELNELRGMAVYGPSLIVANANQYSSFVLQYGGCGDDTLEELRTLVPEETEGLDHPYGLATDHRWLYVTNQGTNSVLRFQLTTGHAAPIAKAVASAPRWLRADQEEPFPGAFAQFDPRLDGVRGVATVPDRGLVFVADKDQGVVVFDLDGNQRGLLDVKQPIGVSYCPTRGTLFIGSKKKDKVYEYSADSLERVGSFSHKKLSHPAGLVCYGDKTLYVISQDEDAVLEFDLDTGDGKVLINKLPDKGEHITLSSQCAGLGPL